MNLARRYQWSRWKNDAPWESSDESTSGHRSTGFNSNWWRKPSWSERCPFCEGSGSWTPPGDFVELTKDPNNWGAVLRQQGADEQSFMDFYNMAVSGKAGWSTAMELIHYILHPSGNEIGNISAYITSATKIFWKQYRNKWNERERSK